MVKNNKGGRRGWATPEQDKFLRDTEQSYLTCQELGRRSLANFWPELFETWFSRWPETATAGQDPSAAIKTTKKVQSGIGLWWQC
jgi:hypothetical protein